MFDCYIFLLIMSSLYGIKQLDGWLQMAWSLKLQLDAGVHILKWDIILKK